MNILVKIFLHVPQPFNLQTPHIVRGDTPHYLRWGYKYQIVQGW